MAFHKHLKVFNMPDGAINPVMYELLAERFYFRSQVIDIVLHRKIVVAKIANKLHSLPIFQKPVLYCFP